MDFPLDGPLFVQALTHSSYLLEHPSVNKDNEQLEFLGDAVLQLCVTDLLLELHPTASEGDLTRMRHLLVDTETLAHLTRGMKLGQHILMARGEEAEGGRDRPRMLANVFEALLGALYQTHGLFECKKLIRAKFSEKALDVRDYVPPKQRLMEWCQKQYRQTPSYREISRDGPPHNLQFTMGVWIVDELIAQGVGSSKKEATIATAINALESLGLIVH